LEHLFGNLTIFLDLLLVYEIDFGVERHVFTYSKGRSSRIYVGVSDLDLGGMTILSTRVSHGLNKLNTKQETY
jgi:hypothetical protein